MTETTLLIIAVGALAVLVSTWIVYPGIMWSISRSRAVATATGSHAAPNVKVVVATRDEPSRVATRLLNLLDSTYPATRLEVVVAIDVKSDYTLAQYSEVLGSRARVVLGDHPGGKAATLNAAVRAAQDCEVLVFADVGQTFSRDAIARLVDFLGDHRFGGVTGRYANRAGEALMTTFASLEAAIRAGQSTLHSVVSTSGSIYAMRRSLWQPLPSGLICDDLFTTTAILRQGFRVGFCANAIASDQRTFTDDQQFNRRVRTLTGLVQFLTLVPAVLLPWCNPVWFHFVMHKLLRLFTPLFLTVSIGSTGALAIRNAPALLLFLLMSSGVAAVSVRLVAPRLWQKFWHRFSWGLRLQLVPVVAMANGLRRHWTVWTPDEGARPSLVTSIEGRA